MLPVRQLAGSGFASSSIWTSSPTRKYTLLFLVMGDHEVDELGDAGFARARRLVAWNDQLRQSFDERVVLAGEELRCVRGWTQRRRFGAGMLSGVGPTHEAWKMGGHCRDP